MNLILNCWETRLIVFVKELMIEKMKEIVDSDVVLFD